MNWLDFLLLVTVLGIAGTGFMQGFLRQAFGLVALYLAIVLAAQYHLVVGEQLRVLFGGDATVRAGVGFVLVFFWGMLFLGWISRHAYPTMRILRLGVLDNLAGAGLGLLMGALVISVGMSVLRFAVAVPWPEQEGTRAAVDLAMRTSATLPFVLGYTPALNGAITPWFPGGVPAIFAQDYFSG